MKYPDDVTILRASGADEYGNPGRSWESPQETAAKAFVPGSRSAAMLPPTTDVEDGDRLRLADGAVFSVDAVVTVRSPARPILKRAALTRVPG